MSAHRTQRDLASVLRDLVDVYYPDAEKIILVMDNLNTHDFSALYETFDRLLRLKVNCFTRVETVHHGLQ